MEPQQLTQVEMLPTDEKFERNFLGNFNITGMTSRDVEQYIKERYANWCLNIDAIDWKSEEVLICTHKPSFIPAIRDYYTELPSKPGYYMYHMCRERLAYPLLSIKYGTISNHKVIDQWMESAKYYYTSTLIYWAIDSCKKVSSPEYLHPHTKSDEKYIVSGKVKCKNGYICNDYEQPGKCIQVYKNPNSKPGANKTVTAQTLFDRARAAGGKVLKF